MTLRNAPVVRLSSAVAIVLATALGNGAHAADKSLSDSVTNAFETIIIDATKAASQATKAAKDALDPDDRKSKRKNATKTTDKDEDPKPEPDAAGDAAAKSEQPSGKQPDKASAKTDAAGKKPDKSQAGKNAPAEPAAKAAGGAKSTDPKDGKPADTATKKPAIPVEWPAADVELAKARCTQLLKSIDAVTIPEAPFRKGDCGAMAPVRLLSIGKDPEVSFSPPPVVTCDLVVGLTKWIKNEVQPAARRHFGAEVIRVESMSDYSCRMAYGRVGNKLSEHGKANALDIRSFTTSKGQQAVVLNHWGKNRRDVLKQLVAARAAAEEAAAAKAAADEAKKDGTKSGADNDTETTVAQLPRKTISEGLAKDGKRTPMAVPASVTKDGELSPKSTNLGGPKEAGLNKDTKKNKKDRKNAGKRLSREEAALVAALPPEEAAKVKAPAPATPTARFLHQIHASACRIFGTTLGPEANEAHRNHFHVDMAERKVRKICD